MSADVVDVQSLDLTERVRARRRKMVGQPEAEPAQAGPPVDESPTERMRRVGDERYKRMGGGDHTAVITDSGSTDHTERIRALRERLQQQG
jgi:hypothetical protein